MEVVVYQERDLRLLKCLFESRVMTGEHIVALFFNGRKEAAKKRLQTLKSAGLIAARPRRAFEPGVWFLARKGLALLNDQGTFNDYPPLDLPALERRARVSDLTLRHELEIMDVKVAFNAALPKTKNFSLAEFTTWPLLYQFEAFRPRRDGTEVIVKPDGFVRIRESEPDGSLSEHTFFLEVDRSSEVLDTPERTRTLRTSVPMSSRHDVRRGRRPWIHVAENRVPDFRLHLVNVLVSKR